MTAHLLLSPPQIADRAEIEALYAQSIRANAQGFIQDLDFHGNIFDLLTGYIQAGGHAVVLKAATQVIGLAGLKPTQPHIAELCKLHLAPQLHRQGLGRLMTQHMLEQARTLGFKTVELHVTTTQTAALQLYRKLGFVEGERQLYTLQNKGETLSFDTQFMSLTF